MEERKPPCLDNLTAFVSFLSSSGNGHSLISSLIDAHKNAMVCREKMVLTRLYSGKLDKAGVIRNVTVGSAKYTLAGRLHKGSNTSHIVPNQFNGKADPLYIIGDKHGTGVASHLANKPRFLQSITKKLNLPIKFIHVYRNPYNVIAHMTKFYPKYSTIASAKRVIYRFNITDRAIKESINPVLSIKFESLIENPRIILNQIMDFLSLPIYRGFIRDCASIINPILLTEYNEVSWKGVDIDKIKHLCQSTSYLNDYKYEVLI